MVNYTKIAVKGAITVFILSIVSAFLGYLVRVTLARNISVEEFGLFYSVFSFLALLNIFKTLGYDRALAKFIPESYHRKEYNVIKSSIIYASIVQIITNTIVIILIYLFSNYLGVYFFHSSPSNNQASIVLKLMAIAFFIDSFVGVIKFSFQGFKKVSLFSGIDLVRMILLLAVIVIGLKLGYGLLSPIIAYIIVPLMLIFYFTPVLFKRVFPEFTKSKFIWDIGFIKKFSKYSFFVMSTTVGAVILNYTDTILLTYFAGLTVVGLYNIAYPTVKILTYIPRSIIGVLLPLSSELWAKRKKALLREGMESLYKYTAIIIVPLAFIMFSFADLLIYVFFGKNYLLASNAIKILSLGMILAPFYAINGAFFSGIGKPEINSQIVYSGAVFNLASNFILIPLWGIIGAATTTTLSYVIMMSIGLRNIRKFIKVRLPLATWAKTLAAGAVFTLAIWLLKKLIFLNVWLETSIVLAVSGIIYIASLFFMNLIDIEEIRGIYRRVMG
jgi:stage V sporulation protein B